MATQTLEEISPWEWSTYVQTVGLRILPGDLREHVVAVERIPPVARSAWISEQALAQMPGREFAMSDGQRRAAERALALGAETIVGRALVNHAARSSAQVHWWHAQAIRFVKD